MIEQGRYTLEFNYRFEAAHRFTDSCAESCATPHGHTWHAKAEFFAAEEHLGRGEMVMEFSKLKSSWKAFIDGTVDHSFMHHFRDPILPSLREFIPGFRGLPFPGDPTTEMIAALFFAKLETMHRALIGGEIIVPVGVTIQETPTNSVSFRGGGAGSRLVERLDRDFDGWWRDMDPRARGLIAKS